jgi:hypothetical protein
MSSSESDSSYLAPKGLESDTDDDVDARLSPDEELAEPTVQKKKRGKGRIYDPFVSFPSKKIGIAALKGEIDGAYWCIESEKQQKEDGEACGENRSYFTCKGLNCKKRAFLQLHPDHQGVTLHLSIEEHEHEDGGEKGLPQATVQKVKQLIDEGIFLPRSICRKIRELGLPQITTKQLSNLKSRYMEAKFGKSSALLNELIDWCDKRSAIPNGPDSDDKVFVAGSKFEVSAAGSRQVTIEVFCIMISTKRLLSYAMKSKNKNE